MKPTIHADFETRSAVDLRRTGVDVYARDASTDALCMAFSMAHGKESAPIHLWKLGQAPSEELKRVFTFLADGAEFVAHNAPFELAIWNQVMVKKHGWPILNPAQVTCTMALAYSMSLPGSLEKAAAAVGITEQKDMAGSRIMMQLAKPREVTPSGQVLWNEDPEKLARLYEYCIQDLKVEQELFHRLVPLSPKEKEIWQLDYRINQRGIQVDTVAAKTAVELVAYEKKRLDEEMRVTTGNAVATCTATGQLTDWIRSEGVELDGVAKADVLELLELAIPERVRRALLLRQEAAKSSNAKLDMLLDSASEDGRVRGIFQYHGAGTGRWAGRRIQPQNFPRPKITQDEIEMVFGILGG